MPERPTVPVTVIVLTKNEAANIDACLDAVRDWATAIFVVDSGSTDDTRERARRAGPKSWCIHSRRIRHSGSGRSTTCRFRPNGYWRSTPTSV